MGYFLSFQILKISETSHRAGILRLRALSLSSRDSEIQPHGRFWNFQISENSGKWPWGWKLRLRALSSEFQDLRIPDLVSLSEIFRILKRAQRKQGAGKMRSWDLRSGSLVLRPRTGGSFLRFSELRKEGRGRRGLEKWALDSSEARNVRLVMDLASESSVVGWSWAQFLRSELCDPGPAYTNRFWIQIHYQSDISWPLSSEMARICWCRLVLRSEALDFRSMAVWYAGFGQNRRKSAIFWVKNPERGLPLFRRSLPVAGKGDLPFLNAKRGEISYVAGFLGWLYIAPITGADPTC